MTEQKEDDLFDGKPKVNPIIVNEAPVALPKPTATFDQINKANQVNLDIDKGKEFQPIEDYEPLQGYMLIKLKDVKAITKHGISIMPTSQAANANFVDTNIPYKILALPRNLRRDAKAEGLEDFMQFDLGDYVLLSGDTRGFQFKTSNHGLVALIQLHEAVMIVRNYKDAE